VLHAGITWWLWCGGARRNHKLFARLCLKLAEAKGKQKRSNTHRHMHSSGRNSVYGKQRRKHALK